MKYILRNLQAAGVSIPQFATITGYDKSTIYKQLRYGFKPRFETIEVYAMALSAITKIDWKIHQQKIAAEVGVWIPRDKTNLSNKARTTKTTDNKNDSKK